MRRHLTSYVLVYLYIVFFAGALVGHYCSHLQPAGWTCKTSPAGVTCIQTKMVHYDYRVGGR